MQSHEFGQVPGRLFSFADVCAFPPFRQNEGDRMGHGAGTNSSGRKTGGISSCVGIRIDWAVRIDALEERMDTRFKGIDARFDSAERLASERRTETLQAIGRLADVYELRERAARIEARGRAG